MEIDIDHGSPEGRAARKTALQLIAATDPSLRAELLTEVANGTETLAELYLLVDALAHIGQVLVSLAATTVGDDDGLDTLEILAQVERALDAGS